jgi:hypothetical protein
MKPTADPISEDDVNPYLHESNTAQRSDKLKLMEILLPKNGKECEKAEGSLEAAEPKVAPDTTR